MRLGKITLDFEYVVDLDDEEMVEHAKNCLYEDIMNSSKYGELFDYISVGNEDKSLVPHDIPSFLKEAGQQD